MLAKQDFEMVVGTSTLNGLPVLFRKEARGWWQTKRWLVQSVIWLAVVNGFVALMLFVVPGLMADVENAAADQDPFQQALQAFFQVGTAALIVGVIVLAQDEIIGEKQSGTAAWLLSKPVSRNTFILSKLLAHSLSILIIYVLLQAIVAYGQLSSQGSISIAAFAAASGLTFLQLFFYLSLTLMMGVVSESRAPVLAVTFGSLLGGQLLLTYKPLMMITPWALPNISAGIAAGLPLPPAFLMPVIATAVWSAIFVVVALWAFGRYEF